MSYCLDFNKQSYASAGNRTRAARVAGEHSTTEPPMRLCVTTFILNDKLRPFGYNTYIQK